MKKDFHFYLIYALAERSGFKRDIGNGETEADVIAYASQYVDDNNESQVIGEVEREIPKIVYEEMEELDVVSYEIQRYHRFPWEVRIRQAENFFRPIMTQTESLKSFNPMFQKYVIMPFHFLPGDLKKIPEIRGKKNLYSTTPNSRNAIKIVKNALDSGDLYRIGVALHTFADTWSHQNFSGLRDDWNAVSDNIILPNIGHAEVLHKPDTISEKWMDSRLKEGAQEIDNTQRAKEAMREIFQWLARYRNPDMRWEDVRDEFERLIFAKDADERIEMVKEMYPNKNLDYKEDKEKSWIYKALKYDPNKRDVVAKEGFEDSHWYKFQVAAKRQLATVVNALKDIM